MKTANKKSPSTNGTNGRRHDGKFGPGNHFGKGNPHARRVAKFRAAVLREVSTGDVRKIVRGLVRKAIGGHIDAAQLILDRCVGPATCDPLRAAMETADAIKRLDDDDAEDEDQRRDDADFARRFGFHNRG